MAYSPWGKKSLQLPSSPDSYHVVTVPMDLVLGTGSSLARVLSASRSPLLQRADVTQAAKVGLELHID